MEHRHKCCNKKAIKKGFWSREEDEKLVNYVSNHGQCRWSSVPELAGLQRCGKSCRLRWLNYLRPDLKHEDFSNEEIALIFDLHNSLGNKWSEIAKRLPGRSDNDIKNFWNSKLKERALFANQHSQLDPPNPHHNIPTSVNVTSLPILESFDQQRYPPISATFSHSANTRSSQRFSGNPYFYTIVNGNSQPNPHMIVPSLVDYNINQQRPLNDLYMTPAPPQSVLLNDQLHRGLHSGRNMPVYNLPPLQESFSSLSFNTFPVARCGRPSSSPSDNHDQLMYPMFDTSSIPQYGRMSSTYSYDYRQLSSFVFNPSSLPNNGWSSSLSYDHNHLPSSMFETSLMPNYECMNSSLNDHVQIIPPMSDPSLIPTPGWVSSSLNQIPTPMSDTSSEMNHGWTSSGVSTAYDQFPSPMFNTSLAPRCDRISPSSLNNANQLLSPMSNTFSIPTSGRMHSNLSYNHVRLPSQMFETSLTPTCRWMSSRPLNHARSVPPQCPMMPNSSSSTGNVLPSFSFDDSVEINIDDLFNFDQFDEDSMQA